jgi:hypothetical protein
MSSKTILDIVGLLGHHQDAEQYNCHFTPAKRLIDSGTLLYSTSESYCTTTTHWICIYGAGDRVKLSCISAPLQDATSLRHPRSNQCRSIRHYAVALDVEL